VPLDKVVVFQEQLGLLVQLILEVVLEGWELHLVLQVVVVDLE
jgi:hypothetical protein